MKCIRTLQNSSGNVSMLNFFMDPYFSQHSEYNISEPLKVKWKIVQACVTKVTLESSDISLHSVENTSWDIMCHVPISDVTIQLRWHVHLQRSKWCFFSGNWKRVDVYGNEIVIITRDWHMCYAHWNKNPRYNAFCIMQRTHYIWIWIHSKTYVKKM